jgi:acetylornithine aminotransferase
LRKICDAKDWFLVLDEVQTGNGRTGKYFAYQHTDVMPDIVTTAKGLGNGIPIGVCLARGKAASVFKPGNHGSTFGGNPFACSVALTVIEQIEQHGLAQRAAVLGERMLDQFKARLSGLNSVKDIRGAGLMIGIELDAPCSELTLKALEQGLLINVTGDKVIRLLPPLIISDAEADQIVDMVCSLVEAN